MSHARYLLPVVCAIHLGHLFSCTAKSPKPPTIVFNDTICHLALNRDNPRDSFDFVYSNAGDRKLVIYSVDPSCHCLTATFDQKQLAKGESSYIRIYLDATNEQGTDLWRTLDVYTNARKEPYTLEVEGTIK